VNGRPWTKREIAIIRRDYPNKATKLIAAALKRPLSGIYKAAESLGVKKSAAFLASSESGRLTKLSAAGIAYRYAKGHVPANAGQRRPGYAPGRMAQTQFKKGRPASAARNYKPIGSFRINADGYLDRKLSDFGLPQKRWQPVHRLIWIEAKGPIPAGHAVAFAQIPRPRLDGERRADSQDPHADIGAGSDGHRSPAGPIDRRGFGLLHGRHLET
jgi:hypothetical protein